MSDIIEVKVGQVWRRDRHWRQGEVIAVDTWVDGVPYALIMPDDGRSSRVSIAGLRKSWSLIKDVQP